MVTMNVESGIQFLTRVQSVKSSLANLEKNLFPDGLKPTDIVELNSEVTCCKNLMLMHFMRKVLLPDMHKGVPIEGFDLHVLFVDTAFQLHVDSFAQYLHTYLKGLAVPSWSAEDEQQIVERSLKNLLVIRCYDSHQLMATFQSLYATIAQNGRIKMLVLDNIGANYWQDFFNRGIKKMELYEKKVLSALRSSLKGHKLPVIYVRPEIFVSKTPAGNNVADYKVNVRVAKEETNSLEATVYVKSLQFSFRKPFTLVNGDLLWST